MDYLKERHQNAIDLNFRHLEGDVYLFNSSEISLSGSGKEQFQILRHVAQQLQNKLAIARNALNDIVEWSDDLELEWDNQGERAKAALEATR